MRKIMFLCAAVLALTACGFSQEKSTTMEKNADAEVDKNKVSADSRQEDEPRQIVLAGGCFWGTEHYLKQIEGVDSTEVGYVNSSIPDPTYQQVCTGKTGAAEGVRVVYDPEKTDLGFLLRLYFESIDPTSLNRQGNDRGTQYRTGIYYTTPGQKALIDREIRRLGQQYDGNLAVEVKPLENFYPAEEYHQDYLDKNPGGYCHLPAALFEQARRAKRYKKPDQESLRQMLTPMQWEVTQNAATEPPFRNEFYDSHQRGIYVDVTTGEPLFLSSDKFDSGCGWPSFSRPADSGAVAYRRDTTHGMDRVEVRSSQGDAHLGHVFPDGPHDKGGLRYCINSASLRFVPEKDMEKEGYGEYLKEIRE